MPTQEIEGTIRPYYLVERVDKTTAANKTYRYFSIQIV